MITHELKILPCYFLAVLDGRKRFEIRFNDDRGFQPGDKIILNEITDKFGVETGRRLGGEITYITNYQQKDGFVVFGFKLDDD